MYLILKKIEPLKFYFFDDEIEKNKIITIFLSIVFYAIMILTIIISIVIPILQCILLGVFLLFVTVNH